MERQLFNLKFTSKQLQRQSKKSEKAIKDEKLKLKKAIEQGNMDGAKIYAENAIRRKNEALNYLRLASRIDAVASRVETAVRMKTVTRSMTGIVKGMDKAMAEMDMVKITQVMDTFEKQFEDLDVKSNYVENAISQTTTLSTPADEVDTLIQQVADEFNLQLVGQFGKAQPQSTTTAAVEVLNLFYDVLSIEK
eukprot:TRINITY_DN1293_c0_g1_i4.p1 TRINITY_DN1293_c0_g1~~TRINITY_DN1293_c0_g1_i4.p1  ORF type:complete len:193 (-),score=64.95 TRINITY_DN1293_c0_g1_i4:59-637(-)